MGISYANCHIRQHKSFKTDSHVRSLKHLITVVAFQCFGITEFQSLVLKRISCRVTGGNMSRGHFVLQFFGWGHFVQGALCPEFTVGDRLLQ